MAIRHWIFSVDDEFLPLKSVLPRKDNIFDRFSPSFVIRLCNFAYAVDSRRNDATNTTLNTNSINCFNPIISNPFMKYSAHSRSDKGKKKSLNQLNETLWDVQSFRWRLKWTMITAQIRFAHISSCQIAWINSIIHRMYSPNVCSCFTYFKTDEFHEYINIIFYIFESLVLLTSIYNLFLALLPRYQITLMLWWIASALIVIVRITHYLFFIGFAEFG